MKLVDRFDELYEERSALADQLLSGASHEEIREDVMNFFEDVGVLLDLKYLDDRPAWEGIGYYGRHWWIACEDYIDEERRRKHDDQTLFARFQTLADCMTLLDMQDRGRTRPEVEISAADIKQFLEEERSLPRSKVSSTRA